MHKAFLGVEPASIEWREIDKNGIKQFAPFSPQFNDIYFNTRDGIAESQYVFIEGNRLHEKFSKQPKSFSIFETGFGTGLNFLLTAKLWQESNPNGHLNYYSVEQYPLAPADLSKIYQQLGLENSLITELLELYPPILPGVFPIEVAENITLYLIFYPLDKALKEIALNQAQHIDAWFLDGFAPSKNPEMWHKGLWHFMALHACNDESATTSLATFTAASEVRKMLQHYGFNVSKRKGFGHKREMLVAEFAQKQLSTPKPTLASSYCQERPEPKKIAVIGAGLAGTALAYNLNKEQQEVHLFEQSNSVASGASKIPALLATPNLSIDHNSYSQLTFAGFKCLQDFLRNRPELVDAYNVIQLESEKYSKYQLGKYIESYEGRFPIEEADEDSNFHEFGLKLMALQVNGPKLCQAFIEELTDSQLFFNRTIQSIDELSDYDHIVIANGHSSLINDLGLSLPAVMPLRGQATQIKAPRTLAHPINFDGHIFQTDDNWLLGATFENSLDEAIRPENDKQNLAQANDRFGLDLVLNKQSQSYTGIRASSYDRFPYSGLLQENDKQSIWLNYGYGTRGLCLSLLGAEIISASILNKTLPVSKSLLQRLSPIR